VKPSYLSLWQQCTHILKQRNAALRLSNGAKQLDYWDKALSDVTDQITKLRLEYIAGLQPVFDRMISGIKGLSRITIQLKQGWPDNKNLIEALQESRALDQKKGFSQFGPHRADLRIMLGAIRAKDLVSRGQQKIITALLKVAQVRCLLDAKKDSSPVILVDDLPAELDEDFRIVLMKEIDNLPVQSFITGTCVDNFPVTHLTKPFQVFHVEHGQVEPLEISIN
jgi:DNA replication and repair protein RecF